MNLAVSPVVLEKVKMFSPHLANVSKWSLVVLLAWWGGSSVMKALQPVPEPVLPSVKTSQSQVVPRGEDVFLFGKPDVQKKPVAQKKQPKVDATDVRDTKLNLKLIGLIGVGDNGVALIQKGAKTLVVAVGETVQTNVTLLEVLSDAVMLDNRGKPEKLSLNAMSKQTLVSKKTASSASKNTQQSHRSTTGRLLSSGQKKKLDDIGKKLKKQPMAISRYIRFQPINQDGSWTGVKLWSKKDKALYRDLGFAEGDVLKEVNGSSIQQMAANPNLWKKFLKQSSFSLVVERNGALETISVNFN